MADEDPDAIIAAAKAANPTAKVEDVLDGLPVPDTYRQTWTETT